MLLRILATALLLVQCSTARPDVSYFEDDRYMHHIPRNRERRSTIYAKQFDQEENTSNYWITKAQHVLMDKLKQKENKNIAKNVIMFLGDGMSIATLAATRAYIGQKQMKSGEETVLSFEEFPHTGLSKTYCVDQQVADSACSATAYLGGVKANVETIGVNGQVSRKECEASMNTSSHVHSIGRWAQLKNKRTGIVTSTRVTHASPAGVYAHVAHRDWESDYDLKLDSIDPKDCRDIAHQLIFGETGINFNVILGGGRVKMLPFYEKDEEGDVGERLDGINLIKEWQKLKSKQKAKYVWNRDDLLNVPSDTDYLLGLFESSHCKYNLDTTDAEPTLSEMTEAAINILSKGQDGYFLFVEGGRIDHAHHKTKAQKALDETEQFSLAIKKARELTSEEDTLIVVTSDHAHTMSLSGYAQRGNDILQTAGTADDKLPYATLSYANGPSYKAEIDGKRHDLSKDDMRDKDYKFPSLAPLYDETHGGDDVGIFASGPWAHLFTGVLEQNVIPHLMAFASCLGNGLTACNVN